MIQKTSCEWMLDVSPLLAVKVANRSLPLELATLPEKKDAKCGTMLKCWLRSLQSERPNNTKYTRMLECETQLNRTASEPWST